MNYREVEVMAQKVVADSGTETIDLNLTSPITQLAIDFKVKNAAAIAEDVPPDRMISKIEIVDGGKVYCSMAGLEAMAVSTYEKRRWPSCWYYEGANGNQRVWIPLQFGRYVGDPLFSLNVAAMLNPQVKVTWAKNALHITNQVELGIRAKVMEGISPSPRALLTKSVRAFTTASSGVESTDIPVDKLIRRLFIASELSGYSITSLITHFKLDCDLGELILFDLAYRKMHAMCENEFGFFTYRKHDFVDSARYVKSWFGRTMAAHIESSGVVAVTNAYTTSSDNYYATVKDVDGGNVTDLSASVEVTGSFPQGFLCYPFGLDDDPETWFDPRPYGQVKLDLTQGVADATARILVQQVVPIP